MADESRWYASHAALPPLHHKVNVSWAGRFFPAIRTLHPKKKKVVWATFKDGEVEYLPPRGRDRIWGDHPSLWQPLDLALWPHPLPEPVRAPVASWPRETAPEPDDVSRETLDPLWWRDATQVAYSSRGGISQHEAEGRIMRALNTNWRIHVESPSYQTNADVLARLGQEPLLEDLDEPLHHDWRPPFEPLGRDLDDFTVSMAWFAALNPKELWHKRRAIGSMNRAQAVLLYRAMDPPSSWGFIGRKWSVSPQRAAQVYQSSLEKITRAANGRSVFKHVRIADPMLEIRERKRRFNASEEKEI